MSDQAKGDGAGGTGSGSSRKKRDGRKDGGNGSRPSGGRGRSSNWGRVLRTAYDDALREPVPDDFLDLLGKLD